LSLYLVDVPHDYAMTDLMNQNKGNDVMWCDVMWCDVRNRKIHSKISRLKSLLEWVYLAAEFHECTQADRWVGQTDQRNSAIESTRKTTNTSFKCSDWLNLVGLLNKM
jgi:hypothetical protein